MYTEKKNSTRCLCVNKNILWRKRSNINSSWKESAYKISAFSWQFSSSGWFCHCIRSYVVDSIYILCCALYGKSVFEESQRGKKAHRFRFFSICFSCSFFYFRGCTCILKLNGFRMWMESKSLDMEKREEEKSVREKNCWWREKQYILHSHTPTDRPCMRPISHVSDTIHSVID